MEYLAIDIETTGLRRKWPGEMDSILSIGMAIDDLKDPKPLPLLPQVEILVDVTQYILQGSIYAFIMHPVLMQQIVDLRKLVNKGSMDHDTHYMPKRSPLFVKPSNVAQVIAGFVDAHNLRKSPGHSVTVAGKNVISFDIEFLNNAFDLEKELKVKHRALDPAMFYLEPEIDDCLPDLKTCKERAGFEDMEVAHEALNDALDVVRLIRHIYTPHTIKEEVEECLTV